LTSTAPYSLSGGAAVRGLHYGMVTIFCDERIVKAAHFPQTQSFPFCNAYAILGQGWRRMIRFDR
jgi:hypothetical protein